MTIAVHDVVMLPIGQLVGAPWNANHTSKAKLAKVLNSLKRNGIVENSVVRPDWTIGCATEEEVAAKRALLMTRPSSYETLSGNHRLQLYAQEKVTHVPSVIVEVSDARARVLAQTLNRMRGNDDPDKLKQLLLDSMKALSAAEVSGFIPQSERDLLKLLDGANGSNKDDDSPDAKASGHDSKVGRIYQLGPHRLLCGSSTDAAAVQALLAGERPILTATDPPYGVSLDQSWRDGVGAARLAGQGSADTVAGDTGFEWVEAIRLPESPVVYVWHADKFSGFTEAFLLRFGYRLRKQIIWNKAAHVMSRTPYQYQHEPCWYAVKAGVTEPWYGGQNQTTVWTAASPKNPMAGGNAAAGEEGKTSHPTQKPVLLFETPIVNHLKVGEVVYEPFAGSGSCLIAAAKTNRRCFAVELEPKWVDVIRKRWTGWAAKNGVDPGEGALA